MIASKRSLSLDVETFLRDISTRIQYWKRHTSIYGQIICVTFGSCFFVPVPKVRLPPFAADNYRFPSADVPNFFLSLLVTPLGRSANALISIFGGPTDSTLYYTLIGYTRLPSISLIVPPGNF